MSRDTFVTAEGEQTAAAGAEAEALVDQGAELVSGSRLRVVDTQTGQIGEVSPEDFRRNRDRFRLQTAAEADTSRRREQFGDRGVETALTSALDTVLLGGVSDRMRDAGVQGELEGLREFNEGAALAGDLAGAVGLGAVGGLPFAGLRGAGLTGRLLAGVGEGVVQGWRRSARSTERQRSGTSISRRKSCSDSWACRRSSVAPLAARPRGSLRARGRCVAGSCAGARADPVRPGRRSVDWSSAPRGGRRRRALLTRCWSASPAPGARGWGRATGPS